MAAIQYPPNNSPSTPAANYIVSPWTAPDTSKWLYNPKGSWYPYREPSEVTGESVRTALEEDPEAARVSLGIGVTVMSISASYTVPVPTVGTPFSAGDQVTLYITPTNPVQLGFAGAIRRPTDSAITLPKDLMSSALYIVKLQYSGSFWMLTSLVGGY